MKTIPGPSDIPGKVDYECESCPIQKYCPHFGASPTYLPHQRDQHSRVLCTSMRGALPQNLALMFDSKIWSKLEKEGKHPERLCASFVLVPVKAYPKDFGELPNAATTTCVPEFKLEVMLIVHPPLTWLPQGDYSDFPPLR